MGPVLVTSLLTLPALAVLLIPFDDESGTRNQLSGARTRQTLASRVSSSSSGKSWLALP